MRDALIAFILVAPVELPAKTFVVTLVLSTRYRPLPVWLGRRRVCGTRRGHPGRGPEQVISPAR